MSLKHAAVGAVALGLALPSGALAAPPPNDVPAGATVIRLPFRAPVTVDEATTDAFEAALNQRCGASAAFRRSVWLRFDATRDTGLIVDPGDFQSVVTRGDPAGEDIVACAFGLFAFPVTRGETYYLMLSTEATPGTPVIQILQRFEIDVAVDRVGTLDRATGAATVSGTVACTYAGEPAEISVTLTQQVKGSTVSGEAGISTDCGAAPLPWTVTVRPSTGTLRRGKAFTVTRAQGSSRFGSDVDVKEVTVRLRRKRAGCG